MIKSFFFESLKIGVDIEEGKQNKLANWYKKVGSVGQEKWEKGMQENLDFNAKISFISKLPKFWKQIKMKCSSLSF